MADVSITFGSNCYFSHFKVKLNLSDEDRAMAKHKHFSWTDDEAELLLNITLEYKMEKSAECIDWESVRSKYTDIRDRIAAHLTRIEGGETTEYGKEYPHRPDEVTKAIVTSKLKGIRSKYRQAVDSGRRSGHGRVVMIFYELCKEIWGGSPATEQIGTGLESTDLETETEPLVEPAVADEDNEIERVQEESTEGRVQEESTVESVQVHTSQNKTTDAEDLPGPSTAQAQVQDSALRKLLDDKLSNYKQKNLRKRLPASDVAAEEREFKKKVL